VKGARHTHEHGLSYVTCCTTMYPAESATRLELARVHAVVGLNEGVAQVVDGELVQPLQHAVVKLQVVWVAAGRRAGPAGLQGAGERCAHPRSWGRLGVGLAGRGPRCRVRLCCEAAGCGSCSPPSGSGPSSALLPSNKLPYMHAA
jgi:hypothetical protein